MKIYKRDDKWGVDYKNPITGKRIREIIGTNKKQAEDRLWTSPEKVDTLKS